MKALSKTMRLLSKIKKEEQTQLLSNAVFGNNIKKIKKRLSRELNLNSAWTWIQMQSLVVCLSRQIMLGRVVNSLTPKNKQNQTLMKMVSSKHIKNEPGKCMIKSQNFLPQKRDCKEWLTISKNRWKTDQNSAGDVCLLKKRV